MLRPILLSALLAASFSAVAADPTEFDLPQTRSAWSFQLSGTAQHFNQPRGRRHHEWNQQNWGVGLQYDDRTTGSPWSRTYAAGTLKDSYGVNGAYVTAAQYYDVFAAGGVTAQAGVGLFALWRAMDWSGKREWLVVPLPVAHFEHVKSGIGVNIVLSPSVDSARHEIPGFLFFQATARF